MNFQNFFKQTTLDLINEQNKKILSPVALNQDKIIQICGKDFQLYLKKNEIDFLINFYFAEHINKMVEKFGKDALSTNTIFIPILKGGAYIERDLRIFSKLHFVTTEYVGIKSYQGVSKTKKKIYLKCPQEKITGKHVILIDEIIDTGETVNEFVEDFKKKSAKSINIFTGINKLSANHYQKTKTQLEHHGVFTTAINFPSNMWAAGSLLGLDNDQLFRATIDDLYIEKSEQNWEIDDLQSDNPYTELNNLISRFQREILTLDQLKEYLEKKHLEWYNLT